MRGVRVRPQYADLIGVAKSEDLENIKSPNRDAKFIREGFISSQLDGEGMGQIQLQQEQAIKEAFKEHLFQKAKGL